MRDPARASEGSQIRRGIAPGSRAALLLADVGPVHILLHLGHVVEIEGRALRRHSGAAASIRTIDLRVALGVPAGRSAEAILARAGGDLVRLLVDTTHQILRIPVARLFPLPPPLRASAALSPLRAILEVEGGHAFLLDPERL